MSDRDDTTEILSSVPGGQRLVDWFANLRGIGGPPNFGDAEVISLNLNRKGPSSLTIEIKCWSETKVVTFILEDWIDVRLNGFSHQNVIGGLAMRWAGERVIEKWELGVGCLPGKVEFELEPCFGANGIIRASLRRVLIEN